MVWTVRTYTFDRDALFGLFALLVAAPWAEHGEELSVYLDMIPIDLRRDLLYAVWLDDEKWI